MDMLKNIALAFIPLFVAVDAIGIIGFFVSLTDGRTQKEKNQIIMQSMLTAICLAIVFILVGKVVFKLMGITIGDFMVAGGAILFSLSIRDIIMPSKVERLPISEIGAVPLGIPLIVGPAVLTTCLVIIPEYGISATIVSIIINVLIAGLFFKMSNYLIKLLGEAGSKALSKVMSLLLAAIAVMLIRKGVVEIFNNLR